VQILSLMLLVLVAVPHLLFMRHPPSLDRPKHDEEAPSSVSGVPLRTALHTSMFWKLTIGFGIQSFASTVVAAFMIAYLIERGDSAGFASAAAGGIGAAQVMARILTSMFGRRFSQVALAAMMFALQMVAVIVLLLWDSNLGVATAVLLLGAGRGALTLIRPILLADAFGLRYFGSISGTQYSINTAFGAIAPVSVGVAYGFVESYQPIMWAMAILAFLSAVVVLGARPGSGTGH
jgi:cyanate permease